MKAIKPLSLGLLHKPYRFAGRDRLVIVALGFFRLGTENREFLDEPSQWPEVLKRLPAEQPLDMAMPKPQGEVLAAATAYAPNGEPVAEMPVRIRVGAVDKRLRVIGEREWRYGTLPLHSVAMPTPFVAMPIGYDRAYGGPAHPGNPIGRGHTGTRFGAFVGVNQGIMPNIEYPDRPVDNHHAALPPAGFGPLDLRWAPRNAQGGSYDQRWLEEQAPGLPLDIDWQVFNAAPPDQRIQGFFQGGEAYRLEGLHPDQPEIEGRLPALRVRAFAQRRDADAPEEVALKFDTVWLFPDAELGLCLYRGETVVADSDAADLTSLLLAYENGVDTPRPAAHYHQALARRLQGRDALAHMANEAPLKPEPDAASRARRSEEQREAEAERLARSQALLDAAFAEAGGAMPEGTAPPKAALPPLGVLPRAALARGDADIAGMLARADARIAQARADGKAKLAELAACRAELPTPAAAEQPDAAGEAIARARGIPQRQRADALLDAQAGTPATAEQRAHIEKLAGNDLDRLGRLAALEPIPAPLDTAAAAALGAEARRLLAAGESLAGRDLAGANLARIQLAGADLRGALLERVDLTGANLAGANLAGAVLTGANLAGANLSDANLDGACCNRMNARGASLKRIQGKRLLALGACLAEADLTDARLEQLVCHQADLSDARIDGAELPAALLLQAKAPGSRWRGAKLDKAVLHRADLVGADFSGAALNGCVFAEVSAAASLWRGAKLEKCFFIAADLEAADLGEVQAQACGWRDGKLERADLGAARFNQCDFSGAHLEHARLNDARMTACILQRTHLAGCVADGLDLFQSQARMADFSDADLSGARFMQADLAQADFTRARLHQARHLPERAVA